MATFRFFHAADLHLDSPFKGLSRLPEPIYEALRRSTIAAFNRLIDFCIEQQVDFLCLCGDLYEVVDGRLAGPMALQRGLWRLHEAGIHSFIIRGNHDPEDGPHAQLKWPPTVHLFSSRCVEGIPFYKAGEEVARIYGRSYPTARFQENILPEYRRDPLAPFAIAMHHTNVDGNGGHENYAPCRLGELVASGMDYWALGHVHKRQILHEAPWVVYPGNLQGRNMKEQGEKGGYLVEVRDGQVDGVQFVPLGEVVWQELKVDLTGVEAEEEMLRRMRAVVDSLRKRLAGRSAMVRLVLHGMTVLAARLQNPFMLDDVVNLLNDEYVHQLVNDPEDVLLHKAQQATNLDDEGKYSQVSERLGRPVDEWRNNRPLSAWVWLDEVVNRTFPSFDHQTASPLVREVVSVFNEWRAASHGQRAAELAPLKALWTHPAARRYLEDWSEEEQDDLFEEAESLLLSLLLSEREGGE